MANADIWSDEEDECLSNKQQGKADKCGRGPWCGGGMTQPLKPLERLGNIEKQDDKSLRRGSRQQKRKIPEIVGNLLNKRLVMLSFVTIQRLQGQFHFF